MIKIHILDCGSTRVDEALPLAYKAKNPLAFTGIFRGKKHQIEVPVRAYLIEHPKGLILVDTGWDTLIRTEPLKYEGFANYFASPGKLPQGQAVTEHLTRLGYTVSDLNYVILTHMDIDHAGGLQLVKSAKHLLVSTAEKQAAAKFDPRYHKSLWKGLDLETFPNSDVDLFKDGTITLIPLPGHSAGMSGIKVQDQDEFVIIAGDSGYCRESFENLELPGIVWNKTKALESLKKLQNYSMDSHCKGILMTHDRETRSKVIEL